MVYNNKKANFCNSTIINNKLFIIVFILIIAIISIPFVFLGCGSRNEDFIIKKEIILNEQDKKVKEIETNEYIELETNNFEK